MAVTGGFWYRGLRAAQHEEIFTPFRALIKSILPARIIEMGSDRCGLCLIMRDLLDEAGMVNSEVFACDFNKDTTEIFNRDIGPMEQSKRIEYNELNFWVNGQLNPLIINHIQRPGPTILLCDGGDKPREFNAAANFLKIGDVIMAHDYAPDNGYFQAHINNKIWNWHETWDAQIASAYTRCNLKPYMAEEFRQVVWVCARKEN
jgi:hypothetical protein